MALRKAVGRPRKLTPALRSRRARDALIVAHVGLVRKVARRIARRFPVHALLDDLISAGYIGLIEAAERFNPAKNEDFAKFAEFRIKGAILDDARDTDTMSRDMRALAKRVLKAERDEQARLCRRPTQEEMAERLGVTLAGLWRIHAKLSGSRVVGFDDVSNRFVEWVTDPEAVDALEAVIMGESAARVARAIRALKPRERSVLVESWRVGLVAAGRALGVTESRACQIRAEAIRKLKAALAKTDP